MLFVGLNIYPFFLVCHRNSDIAFVLDASGSIGEESFKNMKNTIKKLLESFSYEKGHRHAMVVYGGKPSIVFNHVAELSVNERTADLIKTVDEIPYYGSPVTRINAALQLVRQEVFPRYKNQDHRTKVYSNAKILPYISHVDKTNWVKFFLLSNDLNRKLSLYDDVWASNRDKK